MAEYYEPICSPVSSHDVGKLLAENKRLRAELDEAREAVRTILGDAVARYEPGELRRWKRWTQCWAWLDDNRKG